MKTELLPFTKEMIPDAGRLLAQRQNETANACPCCPSDLKTRRWQSKLCEALWQEKLKSGYAAFRDGRMVAYLIGETYHPSVGTMRICLSARLCTR